MKETVDPIFDLGVVPYFPHCTIVKRFNGETTNYNWHYFIQNNYNPYASGWISEDQLINSITKVQKEVEPNKFKEANVVYGEGQTEYKPLPAYREFNSNNGEVVVSWKLSFWERIRVLFGANIWLSIMTFNQPLQPTFMTTKKSDVLIARKK